MPEPETLPTAALPAYAELCCRSNFSFLQGASHPEELVERAHALGYQALALTDECSLAGVVRAHVEAKKRGLHLLIGSQFQVEDGPGDAPPGWADDARGPGFDPFGAPDEGDEAGVAGDVEGADHADPADDAPAARAAAASPLAAAQDADLARGFRLVVLACNLQGYGHLCQFITRLRRRATRGGYRLRLSDFEALAREGAAPAAAVGGPVPRPSACLPDCLPDCLVLALPPRRAGPVQLLGLAHWLLQRFIGRCWLAVDQGLQIDDEVRLHRLREVSAQTAIPLVAVGDVLMHVRSRKPLQDALTATRLCRPLSACGRALTPNAERHLRSRLRLQQVFGSDEEGDLLAQTLAVAARCTFNLDELRYQYPAEVVPAGDTPESHLRRLSWEGAGRRWPGGVPAAVQQQVEHELALIAELRYEHYFLTVADIVAFARSRGILCQGRGSAANSAVCYCLGVTEVDPARSTLLFERFISRERNEPPDIDIDFEHERREEVIQYLYAKYGRDRAALTGALITYRSRSALRDMGKALGFALPVLERLAVNQQWWDGGSVARERLAEVGLDPDDLAVRQLMALVAQLRGFPRHLTQHSGGFVLTGGPLERMVPIQNAGMPGRTLIQWDKDDLDALGLFKVDVLALGMLTAIRKSLDLIALRRGHAMSMQDIPPECATTYDMISRADTVGVFQIESRAQQSMLPRLQPRCFYDLVVEVAIVRPGPIQGGMVHPYLRRRQGLEPVRYPSPALEAALGRTLGVPVFQEQVMQISILAAGFTPGEADALRRAMAAWKRKGGLEAYHAKLVEGMTARGYDPAFAEAIFAQVKGFSEYGFPESHAASFALLVYASCWIKRHHPAEFLAGLLNSQPLGFYTPSQLVQDAQRHGVGVRAIDVLHSHWDATLEDLPPPATAPPLRPAAPGEAWVDAPMPAVRLGLRQVSGLGEAAVARIVAARVEQPFDDAEDLARRAALDAREMGLLAAADALASLSGHRRQQVWDASAWRGAPALLREAPVGEAYLELPPAPEGEEIVFDHAATGLTLRRHPLALLRERLAQDGLRSAAQLRDAPGARHGSLVRACGIVTLRQQPSTARGTVFVTLEDETGVVQVIVWKRVREQFRRVLLHARLLEVRGTWQREGQGEHAVCNLIAGHLADRTPLLGRLATESRNFH